MEEIIMLDLWDPFGTLVRFERPTPRREVRPATRRAFTPASEVLTEGRDVVARFELPGLSAEDVEVTVDRGALRVRGERRHETSREDSRLVHREVRYGAFSRSVQLPQGADPEKVTATFDRGVLEVRVADAVPVRPQPRRVPVVAAGADASDAASDDQGAGTASAEGEDQAQAA